MNPSLDVMGIRKSYGTKEVLRGFSSTFEIGRITALVGPNGAGKTTLLRIIAALQRADSGTVSGGRVLYYGGFDLLPARGTIGQFRRALGLPQQPDGARQLRKLSRGERQKAGLDAALELAPDVLLLDEPWTALEPDSRDALNEELRLLARDRVIICATHDLDEVARVANEIVFLSHGVATLKRTVNAGEAIDRQEIVDMYRSSRNA